MFAHALLLLFELRLGLFERFRLVRRGVLVLFLETRDFHLQARHLRLVTLFNGAHLALKLPLLLFELGHFRLKFAHHNLTKRLETLERLGAASHGGGVHVGVV